MTPAPNYRFPLTELRRIGLGVVAFATIACGSDSSTDPFPEGFLLAGSTTELQVPVNNQQRSYLIHEPVASASTKNPIPLVIVLHGSDQQGPDIRAISGMDSLADARRFVVVYPDGIGSPPDWNAGDCCGDPQVSGVDDIAFLKAIIADIYPKRLPIDTHRIYIAGFSDGGRMAYRAACQMASQIAAVAVVSGSLVTEGCAPPRAVFVIAFHGTLDQSVPYLDPAATSFPRAVPKEAAALSPSIQFWMAENSCTHSADVLFTADVVRSTATGCGAQVIFYTIAGGTHAWPVLGPDYEFSASPLIADFFAAHRLP